jgi:hypothetical protein
LKTHWPSTVALGRLLDSTVHVARTGSRPASTSVFVNGLILIIVVLYRRVEIDRVCKALTRLSIDVLLKIITIITMTPSTESTHVVRTSDGAFCPPVDNG